MSKSIIKLHDEVLEHETSLLSDVEALSDLRERMYRDNDTEDLKLMIPVLNSMLYDVEKCKSWIEEQLNDTTENGNFFQ